MGLDLARKTAELRTKEDQKKSVISQLKSEIDNLVAQTNDISNRINSGGEYRNVKCELEYNYETNKKTIIRTDTMEVVYDGEIPDEERQIEMGIDKLQNEVTELKEEANSAIDAQSPEDEPNDTAPEQSDSDAPQTEGYKDSSIEEEQERLDAEDEKIKKDVLIAQGSVK